MRLVIAIPANQSRVVCVREKPFQRRRFDMTVAKHNVRLALMTSVSSRCGSIVSSMHGKHPLQPCCTVRNFASTTHTQKPVAYSHHLTRTYNFRFGYWWGWETVAPVSD